ncbi:ATPase [Lactobacillus helveticus R0052]|nr:ATPase [Lactobacillus helveticus R0052]
MINEFLKDKKAIYFTAIEENKEDNLRLFLSFGFSLIKCDQHKEKELILKTHFDCLGL